jgi:hypothetical protein
MRFLSSLVFVMTLVSCAQVLKPHPLKGTEYVHRYFNCESVRVHLKDDKKVVSQLRYQYEMEEFRSERSKDGSREVSYRVTHPGGKETTTAFHSGIFRYGPIQNKKQWVENHWYRTSIVRTPELKSQGKYTERKALRVYSDGEDFVEIESVEKVDGVPSVLGELWQRSRAVEPSGDVREVSRLLNAAAVEPGLVSWDVTCIEKSKKL